MLEMIRLDKKGMDISLNFIILAVLALIALIIIALFFTGGLTNLFSQVEDVGAISAEKISLYESKCSLYCTIASWNSWCNPDFPEEFAEQNIDNCNELYNDLLEEDFSDLWIEEFDEIKCVSSSYVSDDTGVDLSLDCSSSA